MTPTDPEISPAEGTDPEERRERRRQREEAARLRADEEARAASETEAAVRLFLVSRQPEYQRFALRLRTEDCPRCPAPTCARAAACESRFEEDSTGHGVDDKPLCKHSADRLVVHLETQRTRDRLNKLESAGIINRDILRIVPAVRAVADALPLGVPAQYLAAPRQAAEAAERFLRREALHLVLWGSVGTWKSWALACIVAGWPQRGAAWLSAREVRPDERWTEKLARIRRAPLLCIADLGTETASGWQRDELAGLITDRDDDGLPVAIATNLTPRLLEGYGVRVWNRLQRGIVQPCVGPSLREVL